MEKRIYRSNLDRFLRGVNRAGVERVVTVRDDGDDVIVTLEKIEPRRETRTSDR